MSSRVSLADNLHNARSIALDLLAHGRALEDRFNLRREHQILYYGALAPTFQACLPGRYADESHDVVLRLVARTRNGSRPQSRPGYARLGC